MLAPLVAVSVLGIAARAAAGDDGRTQLPSLLQNAYFSVGAGVLHQPFSSSDVAPGFQAEAVDTPKIAARVVLFGRELSPYWSAQISYARPIEYVRYRLTSDAPGDSHHVRVNFGALTLRARAPIGSRLFAYGEGGLGITSRTGFRVSSGAPLADAHFASLVIGGGLDYRLSASWDITGGVTYSPGREDVDQPATIFTSGGFRYTMRPLPQATVDANREAGYSFPVRTVLVEYSTGLGYGVNDFVSRTVPIFWGGNAEVSGGIAPHYEQNVFHTRKAFSLDVGASAGFYRTRDYDDRFFTLSVYPVLRYTFLRSRSADVWLVYSLAGPTYISKEVLERLDTGRHFTFQDFLGLGVWTGRSRRLSLGVKINHYSNGNIFTQNAGVKIPLTLSVGWSFGPA